MAEGGDDQDRSEEATPYKLEQARKRGQVPKSVELYSAGVLSVLLLVMYAQAETMLRGLADLSRIAWRQGPAVSFDDVTFWVWLTQLLWMALNVLLPFFLALVVSGIVLGLVQHGPLLSAEPLGPDFSKLNLSQGFGRLFSKRSLFEAGKSIVKLALFTSIAVLALRAVFPGMTALFQADAHRMLPTALELSRGVLAKMVVAVVILAVIDWAYSRWEYGRQMRMSTRDIKDEMKHREGDPRIRSKMRQLRNEMLKKAGAMRGVRDSDVIVTNPTHFAVALAYRPGESLAPKVAAKGSGVLAQKMRQVAAKHGIPIVENPGLARALYRETDFDSYISERLFPEVARLMAWVFAMREARAGATAR